MIEILIYLLVVTHITIVSVTLYLHRNQAHRGIEFHPVLSHFMRLWLWLTQQNARFKSEGFTWHRTGDVGHLDVEGNLWVEGRVVHIIHTSNGSLTPVPLEISCETIPGVKRAAAVGIGDVGIQQVVIVLETDQKNENVASAALTAQVRQVLGEVDVVAVWETKKLPVDIRHNSKIDRTALARKMVKVLSGRS